MEDPFPRCSTQIDSSMDLGGHNDGLDKLSGIRSYDLNQIVISTEVAFSGMCKGSRGLWYTSILTLKHRFVPLCDEGGWILNASPYL